MPPPLHHRRRRRIESSIESHSLTRSLTQPGRDRAAGGANFSPTFPLSRPIHYAAKSLQQLQLQQQRQLVVSLDGELTRKLTTPRPAPCGGRRVQIYTYVRM
jgi:hypothetical protein